MSLSAGTGRVKRGGSAEAGFFFFRGEELEARDGIEPPIVIKRVTADGKKRRDALLAILVTTTPV
jgi:hypothetical protein